jgi:hypothetical protein
MKDFAKVRYDKVSLAVTNALAVYLSQKFVGNPESQRNPVVGKLFVKEFDPKSSRTIVLGEKEMVRGVGDFKMHFCGGTVVVEQNNIMNITIGNISGNGHAVAVGGENRAAANESSTELGRVLAEMIRRDAPEEQKAGLLESLRVIKVTQKQEVKSAAMELLKGFFKGVGGEGAVFLAKFLKMYIE